LHIELRRIASNAWNAAPGLQCGIAGTPCQTLIAARSRLGAPLAGPRIAAGQRGETVEVGGRSRRRRSLQRCAGSPSDRARQSRRRIAEPAPIALVTWLPPSARSTRLRVIVLLTYVVAIGRFSHIIAGSVEASFAVFTGAASLADYAVGFFAPTMIGNTKRTRISPPVSTQFSRMAIPIS
jgi:hypothetical protein